VARASHRSVESVDDIPRRRQGSGRVGLGEAEVGEARGGVGICSPGGLARRPEDKVGPVVSNVIVVGNVVGEGSVRVDEGGSLQGPTPGHIANCVASPTQDQQRNVERPDIPHTLRMAL